MKIKAQRCIKIRTLVFGINLILSVVSLSKYLPFSNEKTKNVIKHFPVVQPSLTIEYPARYPGWLGRVAAPVRRELWFQAIRSRLVPCRACEIWLQLQSQHVGVTEFFFPTCRGETCNLDFHHRPSDQVVSPVRKPPMTHPGSDTPIPVLSRQRTVQLSDSCRTTPLMKKE